MINFFLMFFILLNISITATELDFWSVEDTDIIAEKMTDEELIQQVLLLSFLGTNPPEYFREWVQKGSLGGFKLFGWNSAEPYIVAKMNQDLQKLSQKSRFKIPLFTATDQEGGWVRHLYHGTNQSPGNMAIGAINTAQTAYDTGRIIGSELIAMGVNMNFAPTVDLLQSSEAHVVGTRAFGDCAITSSILAEAFYKGTETQSVISTAKHFPGHGNATTDSHGEITQIFLTYNELWENELSVYRHLIRQGIPAIMSGHIAFPEITGEILPASISPFWLTEILRKKMNFQGLLITDDMIMRGVHINNLGLPELCELAIRAGNDLILVSLAEHVHQTTRTHLLHVLSEDEEFRGIILKAVKRILRYKKQYISSPNSILQLDYDALSRINSEENRATFLNHSAASVTLLQGSLPLTIGNEQSTLVVSPYNTMYNEIAEFVPNADLFRYDYRPLYTVDRRLVESLNKTASNYDHVIFIFTSAKTKLLFEGLADYNGKVHGISLLNPFYIPDLKNFETFVAAYAINALMQEVVIAVLRGDVAAQGVLPLGLFP